MKKGEERSGRFIDRVKAIQSEGLEILIDNKVKPKPGYPMSNAVKTTKPPKFEKDKPKQQSSKFADTKLAYVFSKPSPQGGYPSFHHEGWRILKKLKEEFGDPAFTDEIEALKYWFWRDLKKPDNTIKSAIIFDNRNGQSKKVLEWRDGNLLYPVNVPF